MLSNSYVTRQSSQFREIVRSYIWSLLNVIYERFDFLSYNKIDEEEILEKRERSRMERRRKR